MLQTGTLYSITNNENSVEIKQPIPNVFIYFSQNNARKLTAKTDSAGKFSFDLPLGSYQVTVSRGVEAPIYQIAGGAPFELASLSKQDAFEQWVLAPIYLKPEENPIVILLNNIATEARQSAENAKKSAEDAEKAVGDSVGSGKLMREGAYGAGVSFNLYDYVIGDELGASGFYFAHKARNPLDELPLQEGNFITANNGTKYSDGYRWFTNIFVGSRQNGMFYRRVLNKEAQPWVQVMDSSNTTVDSNGFIKSASPIIRLFDDRIETNDQFKEAPVFEKIGVGTYKISNTLGLAKEGWTYEKPRGKDGNPYFRIIVKKTDDGCIISVHDEFEALEEATITDIDGNERKINKVVKILGEARDIKPHERWIDLRFHEEPEEYEPEEIE